MRHGSSSLTRLTGQSAMTPGTSRLSLPEGTLGQWVTAARKGLGTPGSRTVAELESEILQLQPSRKIKHSENLCICRD
ncbi:hypothetical protein C6553_26530 [Escherichia coli]|nr:hypothetical protein [Escherichia coli]